MTFQPGTDLLADDAELRAAVETCLRRLAGGELPTAVERERVDLKEEAGRRGAGGALLPPAPQNSQAATHLSDEVACMANTPGGGALVVGVRDSDGDLIGTGLDVEWLRHQVYQRVDVAPVVEERAERGARLLVVIVPEAREPIEDTSGRLRWRVGPHCVPVDRGAWWAHRQGRVGWDPMAAPSRMTLDDVAPAALAVARRYLAARRVDDGLQDASDAEVLRRLGVMTTDDVLTQAGALLFCPASRPWLTWTRIDVLGGEVLAAVDDELAGTSVLEQLARVEAVIEAANDAVTLSGSFAERQIRLLPPRTAREAVLNGLVHRDWHQAEPTAVVWVEADSSLEVTSPGGFVGGVTPSNALTRRFARSPALADAVRALGLVDRQGIGVDRMFREMVVLGHRPPLLVEEDGPRVRVRLRGGPPVVPIVRLVDEIEPRARRSDVQVALVVNRLLHEPLVDDDLAAQILQRTVAEGREALEVVASCRVRGQPLIEPYRDVWLLSQTCRDLVTSAAADVAGLRRRGVLTYLVPDADEVVRIVGAWLGGHDRISSGDYARLTGFTSAGAKRVLERLVAGDLLVRGVTTGRNAHFLPGSGWVQPERA